MASERLLELIDKAGVLDAGTTGTGELVMLCPLCSDHKPRLFMNEATGLWICFHCDERGNLLTFLERICRLDPMTAWHEAKKLGVGVDRTLRRESAVDVQLTVEMPEGFMRLVNPANMFEKPFWDYLTGRGVGLPLVLLHRMGYTLAGKCAHRLVIPIYQDHELKSYVARAIDPGREPKVLHPAGVKMSHYLFGLDAVRDTHQDTVIVVEGVFDALALYGRAVATFGAKLSATQRYLLREAGFKNVILMWDADKAGEHGMKKVSGELAAAGFEVSVARLPTGLDPAEASSVDVNKALRDATPVVLGSVWKRYAKEEVTVE